MKRIISLGIASALALSMLAGCSSQPKTPDQSAGAGQSVEITDGSALPPSGGKMMINFEGRVTGMEDGSVTLDSGKTVLIGDETIVVDPDGAVAEISLDDFIQGYAADPGASELEAVRILVTPL